MADNQGSASLVQRAKDAVATVLRANPQGTSVNVLGEMLAQRNLSWKTHFGKELGSLKKTLETWPEIKFTDDLVMWNVPPARMCPFSGKALPQVDGCASSMQAGVTVAPVGGQCPFSKITPPAAAPSGKCPFSGVLKSGFGGKSKTNEARCPLGFSEKSKLELEQFMCRVCMSYYFQCRSIQPCRHSFCAACIGNSSQCPECGKPIQGTMEEKHTQAAVDIFLSAHAHNHLEDGEFLPPRVDIDDESPVTVARRKAFVVLQIGLRSYSGGNIDGAMNRIGLCTTVLKEILESESENTDIIQDLISALSLLGDVTRASGDVGGALAHYQEAARAVNKVAMLDEQSEHVQSTIAEYKETRMTLASKIGDMYISLQDHESARGAYMELVRMRKEALDGSTERKQQLAMGLTKLGDTTVKCGKIGNHVREILEDAIELVSQSASEGNAKSTQIRDHCTRIMQSMSSGE